jgi:hypothetical protein
MENMESSEAQHHVGRDEPAWQAVNEAPWGWGTQSTACRPSNNKKDNKNTTHEKK